MPEIKIAPARLREWVKRIADDDDRVWGTLDATERATLASALAMAADEIEEARGGATWLAVDAPTAGLVMMSPDVGPGRPERLTRYRCAALTGLVGQYGAAIGDGPSCAARVEGYAHAMLAAERAL